MQWTTLTYPHAIGDLGDRTRDRTPRDVRRTIAGDAVDRWPCLVTPSAARSRPSTTSHILTLIYWWDSERGQRANLKADARFRRSSQSSPIYTLFSYLSFFSNPMPVMLSVSEGAATTSKGADADDNLARVRAPTTTTPQTPPDLGGRTTPPSPPSPFTDATSYSALALSSASAFAASAAGTPHTDLTSLPSDVSKLSLGLAAKKPPSPPPPAAVSWPYSHGAALDDIPGIAYALETFLKSQMVESEEYCHRNDPKKCVVSFVRSFVRCHR